MAKVEYSPTERRLLELLRKHRRALTTAELVDLYYTAPGGKPWHAAIVINTALRSLIDKAAHNGEPFIVQRERPPGRRGSTYRLTEVHKRAK